MTFFDYQCRQCGQTRAMPTSRAANANFIRCDACFALTALSRAERLALAAAASVRPTLRKRLGAA